MKRVRWADWNIEHTAEHGVTPEEIEYLILNPDWPYPEAVGDEKLLIRGRGVGGRFIQVIYVIDEDGETAFPIHARPLNSQEIRQYRRRRR
jgi:hypothetical protein